MTEVARGAGEALGLVGAVARLLNGSGSKDAIGRVAELLRRGIPAESVTVWVRQPSGAAFTPFTAPAPPVPAFPLPSLNALPPVDATGLRLPLVHDGATVGLLDIEGGASAPGREAAAIVADLLAPHVALIELSEDLAYEVAVRVPRDRGAAPLHHPRHRLPPGRALRGGPRLPDPDLEPQAGDRDPGPAARTRWWGAPVFDVLTRQSRELLQAEFDQVFEPGQMSQMDIEVDDAGRRAAVLPDQQDPDAAGRRRDHPRDHHRRGRHRVARDPAADPAEREAGRDRPAGRRASCTRSTIRSPPSAPASRRWRAALGEVPAAAQGAFEEYLEIIDKEVAALHRHRGRAARFQPAQGQGEAAGAASTPWSRTPCSCSSTTSASSSSRCTRELAAGPAAGPRPTRSS